MAEDLDSIVSVRLPLDLRMLLDVEAKRLETTVSDVIRRAVLQTLGKPIGWQCEHMDLTAPAGVIVGTPSFGCSCTPEPFFWPTQRRRRVALAGGSDRDR